MRKLAILHSGDLGNVSIGGVSQYIQEIIRHDDNYEVVLFGTCEYGSHELGKEYHYEIDGKKYVFIPVTDNRKSPLSIYYFFNIRKYFKQIEDCDVIYAQRMEYILPFWGRKSRHKTIMAVHGSGAYTKIWRGNAVAAVYNVLERCAMNIAGKIIVLQMREEYGVPYYKKKYRNNAYKIFYGKVPIDEKVFYIDEAIKINKEKNIFNIIYLGRIDDNPKRVLLFPEIVKKLLKKDVPVKMTLIGDGPSMSELKQLISDWKLEDCFDIRGKVNHGKDLTRLINKGDVAYILSSFEGICMSALECIACGVPVVATDVGDIKEYIKNNENGIVIPNSSRNDIIENCVKSTEKIYLNGCKLNDVYKNYSAEKMIDELEEIFKKDL